MLHRKLGSVPPRCFASRAAEHLTSRRSGRSADGLGLTLGSFSDSVLPTSEASWGASRHCGSRLTSGLIGCRGRKPPVLWLACCCSSRPARSGGHRVMPTLERGFKAWAERTAAAVRRDHGWSPTEPLDPWQLAARLGVRVVNPRDYPDLPSDIRVQLLERDPTGWSAATVFVGDTAIIVHNPEHSTGRQKSDIVHELAHIMLEHDPATVVFSEDGAMATRTFNQKQEDEANWLGWTLLLPRNALVAARQKRMAKAQIARTFGVSEKLVGYRLQVTGVDVQMRRRRTA